MAVRLIRDVRPETFGDKLVIATLGNFDGLHLGHQRLLGRVSDKKISLMESERLNPGQREVRSVLISFYPPPAAFIKRELVFSQLMSVREKCLLLDDFQIDYFYLVRFSAQLAEMSARQFVSEVLMQQLNVAILIMGEDAGIGKGREGNSSFIADQFKVAGREAKIVSLLELNGEKVSSRRIRSCLEMGDIRQVNQFLGRPFALSGRVVKDQTRGTKLGFPTANLRPANRVLPRFGVYVTTTELQGQRWPSLTNVGVRPTFSPSFPVVETHLLDFQARQLYGQRIKVEFHKHLRDELKFSSQQGLSAQIEQDLKRARQIIEKMKLNNGGCT